MELINLNNVMATLEEYAIAVRNQYQDNLINDDKIASGNLLNSVDYRIEQDGMVYEVKLKLQDYWKYVEYGTKPHLPPVNKILEWVMVKPVLPRPNDDGKLPTPTQLAWAIAKKIEKKGTDGTEALEEAILDINEKFKEKLVIALHQDMETIMKVVVGDFKGHIPGGLY
jgi:hypothetical protein